ncbi:hypothetical protein [Azospirillum griseum]|uniref:Uncharacterized protein n=1 Tax=Azospirillum griseum TaxID=2496639 RepID=A0A3S0IB66_9PROT|nr:hypothetical protein [Azospirillum griseum]RTR12483.1 hypothetical protein EJ903_25335 [Azospirillum griseum]
MLNSNYNLAESKEARRKIAQLFESLQIGKVVAVDDMFIPDLNVSGIIGMLEEVDGLADILRPWMPEVDFNGDVEILYDQIAAALSNMDTENRENLLKVLFNHDPNTNDFQDLVLLKKVLPETIPLEIITPIQWYERQHELISEASEQRRTIFLFDQELKVDQHDFGFQKGTDIIRAMSLSHPTHFGSHWFCGLLSHTLQGGEEIEHWQTLAEKSGIKLKFFMPIAKSNLEQSDSFHSAIYRALITTYCENLKEIAEAGFNESVKAVIDRFIRLDPLDFEHIIVNSSLHEGVSELETLIRLYGLLARDEVKRSILHKKRLMDFLSAATAVNTLADIDRKLPGEAKARLYQLRRDELYECAELVNGVHDPLRNGDLFEVGDKKQPYVLIAQPCDLMVRMKEGKGKRAREDNFKIAVLAPIHTSIMVDNPIDCGALSFNLPNFGMEGNQLGRVDFAPATVVDLCVLDLAVMNATGDCVMDFSKIDAAKVAIPTRAWRERASILEKKFKSLKTKIEEANKKYKGNDAADQLTKAWMPRCGLSNDLKKLGKYEGGIFTYPIRRCGRIREPLANWLLSAFSRYLARDAYDHDYSEEKQKKRPLDAQYVEFSGGI